MNSSNSRYLRNRFIILVIVVLSASFNSYAQGPVPCIDPMQCARGCKEDRVTCWDVDDPVPLDNGLLLLAGAALTFGLYKLNSRRQFEA